VRNIVRERRNDLRASLLIKKGPGSSHPPTAQWSWEGGKLVIDRGPTKGGAYVIAGTEQPEPATSDGECEAGCAIMICAAVVLLCRRVCGGNVLRHETAIRWRVGLGEGMGVCGHGPGRVAARNMLWAAPILLGHGTFDAAVTRLAPQPRT